MAYNAYLNPLTEQQWQEDVHIQELRDHWRSHNGKESNFASGRLRIALTERCNFACPFCYNEGANGVTAQLSYDDVKMILAAAGPYIKSVKLTGGEPLAHPEFPQIAMLASQQWPTSVTTNGALLLRNLDALRSLESTTVSIQSVRQADYTALMGTRHKVSETLHDIRVACNEGIRCRVNCVVMRRNLRDVASLCLAAVSAGVEVVSLLGMLKLSQADTETAVGLAEVAEELVPLLGEPTVVSATRLRFVISPSTSVELVYQYCTVGCDVCRTDGFIRIGANRSLSFCLASAPIALGPALDRGDLGHLRALIQTGVRQMGTPTGSADPVIIPRISRGGKVVSGGSKGRTE